MRRLSPLLQGSGSPAPVSYTSLMHHLVRVAAATAGAGRSALRSHVLIDLSVSNKGEKRLQPLRSAASPFKFGPSSISIPSETRTTSCLKTKLCILLCSMAEKKCCGAVVPGSSNIIQNNCPFKLGHLQFQSLARRGQHFIV